MRWIECSLRMPALEQGVEIGSPWLNINNQMKGRLYRLIEIGRTKYWERVVKMNNNDDIVSLSVVSHWREV